MVNLFGLENNLLNHHPDRVTLQIVYNLEKWWSEIKKGKPHSIEHNQNVAKALTGKKLSASHCLAISKSHTGYKHSPESNLKRSKKLKGRPQTLESIAKRISTRLKNKIN